MGIVVGHIINTEELNEKLTSQLSVGDVVEIVKNLDLYIETELSAKESDYFMSELFYHFENRMRE